MKKKEIISRYKEAHVEELPEQWQRAIAASVRAREKAHSPYSGFSVGAALILDNGEMVLGSNQENAAYPSGLCAERVALFAFGTIEEERSIDLIAVTATSDRYEVPEPVNPCGACVQVMLEYERKQKRDITVLLAGQNGAAIVIDGVRNLLPFQFRLNPETPGF